MSKNIFPTKLNYIGIILRKVVMVRLFVCLFTSLANKRSAKCMGHLMSNDRSNSCGRT